MSDVTAAERNRAQAYLQENSYRWAAMIESNAETKRNGGFIQQKDSRVDQVWDDVIRYMETGAVSDALVRAIVPKAPPLISPREEIRAPEPAATSFGVKVAAILGAVLLILLGVYFFR